LIAFVSLWLDPRELLNAVFLSAEKRMPVANARAVASVDRVGCIA
jgi:hypothetical protein